ncbi:MAG: glycosyltransferase [Candidatus Diapherotrites archaeon]
MTTPNSTQNELVVLMPARDEAQNLPASLSSVNASKGIGSKMHVLVCANACQDNTVEVLEGLKKAHRNMDFITESVPGKPRALNALIDKTEQTHRMESEDVVVFLDANARVQPDTLASLTHMLHSDKGLNAVSANDVSIAPKTDSVLDHLLFGVSDISLSALALRDRKASCTAVRAKSVKGVRFPEHVIADDLWLSMYLGMDTVETHPSAHVIVPRTRVLMDFFSGRVKHLMGLYQLEEFYPAHEVRAQIPTGIHEHVQALMSEPELQDQFAELPAVYKAATLMAIPVHAALKAVAWVGYHLMPQARNHSIPIPQSVQVETRSRSARRATIA